MKQLTSEELKMTVGGGFNFGLAALIGAGITFLIGLVDGYIRPLPCN